MRKYFRLAGEKKLYVLLFNFVSKQRKRERERERGKKENKRLLGYIPKLNLVIFFIKILYILS